MIEEIFIEMVINFNVENWLMLIKGCDKNDLVYCLLILGDLYLVLVFVNICDWVIELVNYL